MNQICSNCKEEKNIYCFSKGGNKNGRRSWCKTCISKNNQQPEIKEKLNQISRDRYIKYRKEIIESKKNDIQNYLFFSAKSRAKQRNHEFNLVPEDIIVSEYCPLLGIKMQYNEKLKKDNSFSLDRIDSSKGYTKENIWVISLRANRIKNDSTIQEMEQILENWKKQLTNIKC